uniref:Uncharacterized protein n=1 Tax=Bursaphelenchus xylophilus TaxID=6326 RepID=A0A1I7SWE0_BURXY
MQDDWDRECSEDRLITGGRLICELKHPDFLSFLSLFCSKRVVPCPNWPTLPPFPESLPHLMPNEFVVFSVSG